MNAVRTAPGALPRAQRALLLAAAAAAGLALAMPGAAHGAVDPTAQVPEFNRICSDLAHAREELRSGFLDESDFGDRILDLFVQADSLRTALLATAPAALRRPGTPAFAMERGLRYLIESLRQNYVGMAGQNGLNFLDADMALQAAVAWRSGAMGGGADAELP
jgi:hypothetical protein